MLNNSENMDPNTINLEKIDVFNKKFIGINQLFLFLKQIIYFPDIAIFHKFFTFFFI